MTAKRWSLARLLLWVGTTAQVVLLVPIGLFLTHTVLTLEDGAVSSSGLSLAKGLRGQIVEPMLLEDRLTVHDALHRAAGSEKDLRYLGVTNARGEVIAHTFPDGYPKTLGEMWRTGTQGVTRFRTAEEPLLDVSVPLMDGQLGSLHVGMSRRRAEEAAERLAWWMGGALAASLAVVLAGAQLVSTRVSRPLRRLEEKVSLLPQQARAGMDLRVSGTKEVVSLAERFSDMADRLASLERERAATQEKMVHAERLAALGEMSAGLAHEVCNPLDGMLECLRYLQADPQLRQREAKYYPMLQEGLERIGRTMKGMLTFARSGHSVEAEPCNVSDMITALKPLMETHMKGRNVRLTWSESGDCTCLCNRQGLAQTALNLVLNAADAAEGSQDPQVRIETSCDADSVYIYVDDSGTGVPQKLRDEVFAPFFTTKQPDKGTGLGLSVSRQLIRAAGGELELATDSGGLGGARFVIRLPKAHSLECTDGDHTSQHSDR